MEKIESFDKILQRAKDGFQEQFGEAPTIAAQAPGRVNIIGDHVDYCDGLVMPMAVNVCTVIVGKPNSLNKIRLTTVCPEVDDPKRTEFDPPTETQRLIPGLPNWANYVKGVIEHFPVHCKGFDACTVTSVPIGGGLSSSASIEVATCTFLEGLTGKKLTGKKLTKKEKSLICQKAEHTFPQMPCGIMDQAVSVMGEENAAILLDCRSVEVTSVKMDKLKPADGSNDKIAFLVMNSNVKHQLTGSEYPQRRADCEAAVKNLGLKSMRDVTVSLLQDNREKLGERMSKRALHAVTEIERVLKAAEYIAQGDVEALGRVMYQSHVSLRDLMETSCPEIDELVELTMKCPGVYGSRITGGGFGGCTVTVLKASEADKVFAEANAKYQEKVGKKATGFMFTAKQGSTLVKL